MIIHIKEKLIRHIFNSICFLFIAGCASEGNKPFNILDEAKSFLYEELGFEEKKDSEQKIIKQEKIQKTQTQKRKVVIDKKIEIDKEEKKRTTVEKIEKHKNEFESLDAEKEIKKNSDKILQSRLLEIENDVIENNQVEDFEFRKDNFNKKTLYREDSLNKEQTLNIGVLLPLTGKNKSIGQLILKALEVGIFQNNNPNIELIIKDTKADPITTIEAFDELLGLGIENFIGPLFASSLLAIEEKAISHKVNVFALTNNTNMAGKNIWVFGIDPQQQAKKVANFAIEEGLEKIALLLPKNEYGYLILDTMNNTLGEEGLKPERIEFFDNNMKSQEKAAKKISQGFGEYNDFIAALNENKNSQEQILKEEIIGKENVDRPFDSVFIAASGQNLTILASQLQYNGVDPRIVSYLGTASWEKESILREPALEGGFFSTTGDGYQKNIKDIYKANFDEDMTNIAMLAYDILALLSINLQEYKKIDINNLINDEGFIGLRGLFRLKRNGIVERSFQIKKIKNKKFLTYRAAPESFNINLY